MTYHLAQLNVAKMRAGFDDPSMAEFVAALEPVNALADRSPGFVWRLQDDSGDATSIRVFEDPNMLVNLSVWRGLEELKAFVYGAMHVEIMRSKKQWFHPPGTAHLVLWWVAADHRPALEEAAERLELLRTHGPTERAFTFSRPFSSPAQ